MKSRVTSKMASSEFDRSGSGSRSSLSFSSKFGDSADENSDSTSTVLSGLHIPRHSEIGRKWKTRVNPPSGKKRSRALGNNNPKTVSPSQRVSEFPDEQLAVVDGNLFCNGCREELSVKSSSLKNHFKSGKHQVGKLLKETQKREIWCSPYKSIITRHI